VALAEQHRQPERRAPRWLKWINPINRFLLKRGIGPPPQHLLATLGRKSGKTRTTPVAVVAFEGERYLVAGFDGSDWVKNARAAGRGQLQRGRTVESVVLVEVPLEQRAPILQLFADKIRGGQAFLTVSPNAPRSAFVEAAPRHPIFRLAETETSEPPAAGTDRD
jgi:deazaflavin-dependent oxidoreductase (nitroreductase family)